MSGNKKSAGDELKKHRHHRHKEHAREESEVSEKHKHHRHHKKSPSCESVSEKCERSDSKCRGPRGRKGRDGKDGCDGRDGKDGRDGAPGATGPRGPPGGLPGPQGVPGVEGRAGSAGSTGAQGIPGIQGVEGQRGLQGEQGPIGPISGLAFFYNTVVQAVSLEADVSFDTNGLSSPNITHVAAAGATGAPITLVETGTYDVTWSLNGLEPNQFSLFLNGVLVPGSTNGSGGGFAQTSGSILFGATAADVLTLRNHSSTGVAGTVNLNGAVGGSAAAPNAWIKILKIV